MTDDPIIEELHRVKDELSLRFAGDAHSLFESLRETEDAQRRSMIVLEPVPESPSRSEAAPERADEAPK